MVPKTWTLARETSAILAQLGKERLYSRPLLCAFRYAPVYVNCVALATSRLTILRERDRPFRRLRAERLPLATSRNSPVGREKRLTGKVCFWENPKSPKASEHKGFTLPSRSYLPLMSKDSRVTSGPLMRVLRGEMKGLFMFTATLMRQAGLLFCLSLSNISVSYTQSGSAPISGRGALEAACLMPPGLRKQPDLPRQLAHCPKKSLRLSENGQSRTKFKHKSNQPCHSKLGGYAACYQLLACSLASTLVLSSILLPQTKTLPEYWGKCVQIYRTTTGGGVEICAKSRPVMSSAEGRSFDTCEHLCYHSCLGMRPETTDSAPGDLDECANSP